MTKKTSADSTGVVALKGELVDKKLVEEAVEWIKQTAVEPAKKAMVEVGEYILKKFFQDDVELAKSKNPFKNASFRALADRCGTPHFPLSKTWLNNAVGVAMMSRQLPQPTAAFKQLPSSAQERLLSLKDPDRVEKVAKKAIESGFTIVELRTAVRQERAKMPKDESRGRPPTPVITKALDRSLKQFTFEGGKRSFTRADLDALGEDQKRDALKSAEKLAEKLKALIDKLKNA